MKTLEKKKSIVVGTCNASLYTQSNLKYADELWGGAPRTKTGKQVHTNMGPQTLPFRVTPLKECICN
jgi:hypothetical protein